MAVCLLAPTPVFAQWGGFRDDSAALATSRFPFTGSAPEAGTSNENYYDGDLGDFNGDGLPDRLLGSRYGLLLNTGRGYMIPIRRRVGLLLRGDPGASGWGEDAMQWTDIDGDGDLEALAGGNGEPLTAQWNDGGRFSVAWVIMSRQSALNIVDTDLERDGDVDVVVAHAFCNNAGCGGPVNFGVFRNDGTGTFTEVTSASGFAYGSGDFIVGVVSGDVDGDGDFDLLIQRGNAMASLQRVVVALNDGTGRFTQRDTTLPISGSGFGQGMNLGDIDDDGDLDLVLTRGNPPASPGDPVISTVIGINDGAGNFTDESAARLDDAGRGGAITGENGKLMDVDYDGDLDIVQFDKDNMAAVTNLWVLTNDGTGRFVLDLAHSLPDRAGPSSGLGSDLDVADLDGDGTYDLWVGLSGGNVAELMNTHVDPTGLHADTPRGLTATAGAGGITLRFTAPPFAANARQYVVYRSLADGLGEHDRTLLHRITMSPFQDEGFVAPITHHTTTAELGDPAVTLTGARDEIAFVDATAVPGIRYHYAVSHVGVEHEESEHTALVSAARSPAAGADTTPPVIEIVSPEVDEWGVHPRVVVTYGDGQSGIDPSSLSVSFDQPAGARAAGTSLVDLALRHDASAFVAHLTPPESLPSAATVRMTASIRDMAGNTATATVTFATSVAPDPLPTAAFTATPRTGAAPLAVDFDASASTDGGAVMAWEWTFGDGATGRGRFARHVYTTGGTHTVTLRVRDDRGGVAVATTTVTVTGSVPVDAGMPDAGVDACMPDCAGRTCGPDGCGGDCGTCGGSETCAAGSCTCAGSLTDCAGSCVDVRIDEANCGGCGVSCGAGETCVASRCTSGVPDAGMCVPDCAGRACGDDTCGGTCGSCGAGATCGMGGSCVCAAGELCGGACVDTDRDPAHCGGCGMRCAGGAACVLGTCMAGTDGGGGMDAGISPPAGAGCACRAGRGGALPPVLLIALALLVVARRR